MLVWEVRNLGFGERAARGETSSRYRQAVLRSHQVQDQIAEEVRNAWHRVRAGRQRMDIARDNVSEAVRLVDMNFARIRGLEGLPLGSHPGTPRCQSGSAELPASDRGVQQGSGRAAASCRTTDTQWRVICVTREKGSVTQNRNGPKSASHWGVHHFFFLVTTCQLRTSPLFPQVSGHC